jgi:hypothetical protein
LRRVGQVPSWQGADPFNQQQGINMSIINPAALRSASTILRDGEGLGGHRLVTDDAATLCVQAFPFAAAAVAASGSALAVPAAYLLVDSAQQQVYVGETNHLGRRLQEHALHPAKSFAVEVFALRGRDRGLEKPAVVHFQKRLSERIEIAGRARLVNVVAACAADLTLQRQVSLDRMFEDGLRLLLDAGCRCLWPRLEASAQGRNIAANDDPEPRPPRGAETAVETAAGDEEGDEGPMQIGVTVVPLGVEEQMLWFGNLWARGYDHEGTFVVAAGSEMRRFTNPSANAHTVARRQRLIDTGTAITVDGLEDRLRLQVAVAFPSRAIAAKVLTGAHVGSEKWRALQAECPCVIAI